MQAGKRNRKITIERATYADNSFGEPVETWTAHTQPFAEVRFGSAQERRDGAQEIGGLTATFVVLHTATTAGVTLKDRISFDGGYWDIVSNVPSLALNRHREITGVRSV